MNQVEGTGITSASRSSDHDLCERGEEQQLARDLARFAPEQLTLRAGVRLHTSRATSSSSNRQRFTGHPGASRIIVEWRTVADVEVESAR